MDADSPYRTSDSSPSSRARWEYNNIRTTGPGSSRSLSTTPCPRRERARSGQLLARQCHQAERRISRFLSRFPPVRERSRAVVTFPSRTLSGTRPRLRPQPHSPKPQRASLWSIRRFLRMHWEKKLCSNGDIRGCPAFMGCGSGLLRPQSKMLAGRNPKKKTPVTVGKTENKQEWEATFYAVDKCNHSPEEYRRLNLDVHDFARDYQCVRKIHERAMRLCGPRGLIKAKLSSATTFV